MSFWPNSEALNLTPIKQLCRLNVDVLPEDTDPDLEFDYVDIGNVTLEDGIKQKERIRFEIAPSRARKRVRTGDVIVSTVRTYLKAVARIDEANDGAVVSTGFAVLRPKASVEPTFLYRLCQSNPFVAEVQARSTGVSYPAINPSALGAIKVPLPDLDTQRVITAFLDRETARIDQLIQKKERQSALLLDKEASLLDGLTFRSKWSHAEQAVPFKWICRIPNGQVDPTEAEWADLPLIAPNHIEQGTGRLLYTETARAQGADSGKYAFPAGTVVYSKIRPNLAKACIAPDDGLCSADMYPIIPEKRLRPQFLLMQLLSRTFTDWATTESMRVAMPKINRETIGTFRLLAPPFDIQEAAIREWLSVRGTTERARRDISKSVSRLKEKRAALITAAVTGQIDVRQQPTIIVVKPDRNRFRVIVGAEIVQHHQGNAKFGRVKLQKELYLAEAHAGITELQGNYLREAAGPLDRTLVEETEGGMEASSFFRAALPDIHAKTGSVTYMPLPKAGQHRPELEILLGPRVAALRQLIQQLSDFDTRAVEAIATLYAVWNDALIDGGASDDDAIVRAVLNDWHPEKREKFKDADLRHWLDWMKRNRLIPTGKGPRTISTTSRDLFA